jgi:DeoR/GlpR family transcriptional regulator of sugar metabolism
MATKDEIGRRQRMMLEDLANGLALSMVELCRKYGVSESTLRRDLDELAEQGRITRTRGTVHIAPASYQHSLAYAERETANIREKMAIARAVAEMLPGDRAVILDGGTTCFEVARIMGPALRFVVTNSVQIAWLLAQRAETEITLIGGRISSGTRVAVGTAAVEQLRELGANSLVMSCSGITDKGVFNVNQDMVEVEQRMMDSADEVILAVDHTKFGHSDLKRICGTQDVDAIVTDEGADERTRELLARLGESVKVVYAPYAAEPAPMPAGG